MAVKTIAFMLPWVDPLSANSNLYNAGVIARIETSIADRAITAGKALEINANIFDQQLNTTDSPTFAGLTVDTNTLFVDAANNRVGIGTTSLAATLHVLTASSSTGATPSASADDLVVERNGFSGVSILSGTTSEGSIYFGDSGSATIGRIVYNHSANDLSFFTNNTKRVTIDSGGDVGIGTTAPDNKIHVRSTANLVAKFENTAASGNARAIFKTPSYEWNIGVNNSGGSFTLYDGTNNIVQVLSGAPSNSLYVNSSGNVGIGTTSPSEKLHVAGSIRLESASNNGYVFWEEGTGGTGIAALYNGTGNRLDFVGGTGNDPTAFATSIMSMERDSGNVGIGTTSPSATLHTLGTTYDGGIFVEDSSFSGAAPAVRVLGRRSDGNNSSAFAGKIALEKHRSGAAVSTGQVLGSVIFGGNHTDGTEANISYPASIVAVAEGTFNSISDMPTGLVFFTGSTGQSSLDNPNVSFGTERMRIDENGNVGIGTTSPSQRLHVAGNAEIEATTTGAPYLFLTNETSGELARIFASNSSTFYLQSGGSGDIVFQSTTNSEIARLKGSTGNVGIGTTGPSYKIDVQSAGGFAARFKSTVTSSAADVLIIDKDNTTGRYALDVQGNAGAVNIARFHSNGRVSLPSLPTTATGLSAGDLWNDGGTLKIA